MVVTLQLSVNSLHRHNPQDMSDVVQFDRTLVRCQQCGLRFRDGEEIALEYGKIRHAGIVCLSRLLEDAVEHAVEWSDVYCCQNSSGERLDRWAQGLDRISFGSLCVPIWRHEVLEFVDTIFEASAMTLGAREEAHSPRSASNTAIIKS